MNRMLCGEVLHAQQQSGAMPIKQQEENCFMSILLYNAQHRTIAKTFNEEQVSINLLISFPIILQCTCAPRCPYHQAAASPYRTITYHHSNNMHTMHRGDEKKRQKKLNAKKIEENGKQAILFRILKHLSFLLTGKNNK